jgi:hypothetical protein
MARRSDRREDLLDVERRGTSRETGEDERA